MSAECGSRSTRWGARGRSAAGAAFAILASVISSGCRTADAPAETRQPVSDPYRIEVAEAVLASASSATGRPHRIASVLHVPYRMTFGDYAWHDGVTAKGDPWVLVDLAAQTISVFRGDDEIGTSVMLYGVDDHATPTGSFHVLQKSKDYRSRAYDAPMPYSLRLTADGVAIHGSDVVAGAGTHGCLGVPLGFGRRLFEVMKVGDDVLILQDATLSLKRTRDAT